MGEAQLKRWFQANSAPMDPMDRVLSSQDMILLMLPKAQA